MNKPARAPASSGVKQFGFVLLFATLVGAVPLCRDHFRAAPADAPGGDALARYGCRFEEVAKQAKLDFTHHGPTLDAKLAHIMPIVAAMGAAVSVTDFDRDGWYDLYVTDSAAGGKNRLYRNKHDGTFEDVAEAMGVADLNRPGDGACMGAVWGDYDNDGFPDLFVYRWGRPELFHNDAGQGFTRVTDKAGMPTWVNANSAVWLDFDNDGQLDLFLAGYWADDIDLWHLTTTAIMPESFEYADNGGRKYLLRNNGDGTFEDVAEKLGITSRRWTLAVAASDLRGTGYPDLILANDYGVNEVFANHEGKKFTSIGPATGIGDQPKSGMSASLGDIYNQGRLALYVSNISEKGQIIQGNNLWVPRKGTAGDALSYTNHANGLGVDLAGWSWGAQFGDLNNDGRIDLFLTNGYVSADRTASYWYDYSRIAGANKAIIGDAANWPDMKGRSLAGYQHKCVWLNRGGRFDDVASAAGVADTYDGRAVALADLWNRGVLDVVCANQNGPLLVYKTTADPKNHWVQFELEGAASNRDAIGAQVRVYWNGQVQCQEVSGGSGYAAQNMRRLHFGLGPDAVIDRVEVRWPSGRTETLPNPPSRTVHKIKETS